jgi:RND family efflux transporter MFP subunit
MNHGNKPFSLFGAACLIALAMTACKGSHPIEDPRTLAPLVAQAPVQPAASSNRAFTGVVTARVQSNLGFRIPGKVVERLVDTGQPVRKGQPLMRLDRTDYAHAITGQTGSVDAARARMLQATADEERYRGLVASGAVSKSAYDLVKASAEAARALLSAAQAQLQVAQDQGDYSVLKADADGTVVETLTEPGQFVAAGQIVVRLAHAGPREAAVNLPETVRPALGSTAYATLYGFESNSPSHTPVRLRQLSDAADPATRTFEARFVLEGDASKAPLGSTVTVYLDATPLSGALTVPFGAIDDEGAGPGVWLIDSKSSSVSFRPVTATHFNDEQAIVNGDVHLGDSVVATGGHYLHEGEQVRVTTLTAAMQ